MLGPWPNRETISFVNPVDVAHNIFVWSCGTHSLKAIRNNVYRIQPKFPHNLKVNGIFFGWKEVKEFTSEMMLALKTTAKQELT